MKLNIKKGDRWETNNCISYRASQESDKLFKSNWRFLSVEIGDIREMSVKNFYAVALKLKYNVSDDDFSFIIRGESCTANYNSKQKIFNVIEKPRLDDPMGITTLTLMGKDILQIEYLDSSNNGSPGNVYVANLHKK